MREILVRIVKDNDRIIEVIYNVGRNDTLKISFSPILIGFDFICYFLVVIFYLYLDLSFTFLYKLWVNGFLKQLCRS